MLSRNPHSFAALLSLIVVGAATPACENAAPAPTEALHTTSAELSSPTANFPSTFARQWMTNVAFSVKYDGINPPVAARSYAYAALTIYESVVHGMPGYVSMAGQINGLDALPVPDPGKTYDWPTVLAAAMARVVPATFVFPNTLFFEYTTATQVSLRTLGPAQIAKRTVQGVPADVIADSTSYGQLLGDAIAAWANADGFAESRYKAYIPPATGGEDWTQTGYVNAQASRPLLPHYGEVRPIALMTAGDCLPPPPVPFSTDPSSEFYAQANEVYQTDLNLTKEQREIALFWADGNGSETPPGHWVKIANDLVRPGNLADAARVYPTVAIPVFDAGIATWHAKYHYNIIRPETYIHKYISSQWLSMLPSPQFPSYTSGHSGFSAAAAAGLGAIYGTDTPFTDRTKVRGGFKAVTYPSFMAAAEEASASRIYGGIHYRMDAEQGVALGQCVANAFLNRVALQ